MKEEKIREIIELTKERDKILSQFRKYFGVTDPNFQPVSLDFGGCGDMVLVSKNGKRHRFTLLGKSIIEETKKEIPVNGLTVAMEWIGSKIKKLESINKKLEEL